MDGTILLLYKGWAKFRIPELYRRSVRYRISFLGESDGQRVLEDEELRGFLKALGDRIRQLRKGKGLDMRAIMIASGYYDAQWRKYETGSSMNVASLMRVALTLQVSLADLLDGLAQWPILSVSEIRDKNAAELDSTGELELEPEPELKLVPDPEPDPEPKLDVRPKSSAVSKKAVKAPSRVIKKLSTSQRRTTQGALTPRKRKP